MTADELLAVLQSLSGGAAPIDEQPVVPTNFDQQLGPEPAGAPAVVPAAPPDPMQPIYHQLGGIQQQAQSVVAPADVPLSPDAVPNSAFALTEPRTTLPPMPTPPPSVASDPRRDLLRMIVLGFMAGAGPKSGFGTGAGQGLLHGQAVEQAELDKQYKIKEAEALRQQTIFAAQQRAEHQDRQRMLAAIEKRVSQMPDVETYQREMRGYGDRMVMNGFRDNNAAALMRMFPFVPPDKDPRMVEAWKGWKNNEGNKLLLEQQPEKAVLGSISVNVAPRGQPPKLIPFTVAEVAKAAGEGFAEDPLTGKPIVVPKAAAASGEFPTVLKGLQEEFEATYRRTPTPAERNALIDEAVKKIALANPIATALRGVQLETARRTNDEAIRSGKPIEEGSREYKVAEDLASGRLTIQQFRSLYSYSRDVAMKIRIYDKAGEINPDFNPAAFEMGFSLAKNPRVQQQLASLDNVLKGVPDLLKFSAEAKRTNTGLNDLVVKGGVAIGDKRYSDFRTARIAFADELSGALGYGTATDMSREMGFNMADMNLNADQFAAAINSVIVPFVQRKRDTLLKQMGPYGQSGMNPGATPSETQGPADLIFDPASGTFVRPRGKP